MTTEHKALAELPILGWMGVGAVTGNPVFDPVDAEDRERRPGLPPYVLLTDHAAATAEIARLTTCLRIANSQHEHFEREWYLRGDEIERLLERVAVLEAGLDVLQAICQELEDDDDFSAKQIARHAGRTTIAQAKQNSGVKL